jgi:hypothetical protein
VEIWNENLFGKGFEGTRPQVQDLTAISGGSVRAQSITTNLFL